MAFDKRAFDRAQRRKMLVASPPPKPSTPKRTPKKSGAPKRTPTRKPTHVPTSNLIQKRRRADDARIERKVAEYAEGDEMCDDVVAILQTLCEKLGR